MISILDHPEISWLPVSPRGEQKYALLIAVYPLLSTLNTIEVAVILLLDFLKAFDYIWLTMTYPFDEVGAVWCQIECTRLVQILPFRPHIGIMFLETQAIVLLASAI